MNAAAPVTRKHRRRSGVARFGHLGSTVQEALAVRGVGRVTRSYYNPVESIVVVGTKIEGGRE
jgi:hypothetical protein